jgi:glycosyltransferase involved in cell wall biosynthesis
VLSTAQIAVVVPAFNEERWIAETVGQMPDFVDHILVVDDASKDGTSAKAQSSNDARVEVLRHKENRGVGAAIITGYRRARVLGADIIAVMAGDGQMHPDDLSSVVLPIALGEADYVKGNRLGYPGVWRIMPPLRLVGTFTLAFLTRHATGLDRLSDSQCGYTAIATIALDTLDLEAIWPRYGYPNDLLGALARRHLRVGEVIVRPIYRGEASGLRPWHMATIGFLLGRVLYRRLADRFTVGAPNNGRDHLSWG